MIQSSNLEDISKSDLPTTSQEVVNQDYFDYMDVATRQASGLGYEVALAGRGHRVGSSMRYISIWKEENWIQMIGEISVVGIRMDMIESLVIRRLEMF